MPFKIGDILRYGNGPTALMRVSYVSHNHGGKTRYYGQQCMGGSCGAYHGNCTKANAEDRKMWFSVRKEYPSITPWQLFCRDMGIVGAVED